MLVNTIFQYSDGNFYALDENGKMVKNHFVTDDNRTLYFGSDGKQLFNTEITVEGQKYTIDSNGIVKEAPYYSAPAPLGGTYNFYLKKSLPWDIRDRVSGKVWTIETGLKLKVIYSTLFIEGTLLRQITENYAYVIGCKLAMTNNDGITTTLTEGFYPDIIEKGQRTYMYMKIDGLPLVGADIYLDFYY